MIGNIDSDSRIVADILIADYNMIGKMLEICLLDQDDDDARRLELEFNELMSA